MSLTDVQVTSIDELKKVAMGELVELPPFVEGAKFIARLRKPSMMALAKSGRIPNALLQSAQELFGEASKKGAKAINQIDNLSKMYDICKIMAEAAMLEPTYKSLEEAGIELTDNQLMAIFAYTQAGVKSLESFREDKGGAEHPVDGEEVPEAAV